MAVHVDMADAQFENVNELRSYPFAAGSSLVDKAGREVPSDVVVDIHMALPVGPAEVSSVRMTSVHLSKYMISVCFRAETSAGMSALSATVSASVFRPYMPYRLEKVGGTLDAGGIVTFGNIRMDSLPETYFLENAAVHPCCIAQITPPGIKSFVDPRSGERVSGDASIDFSGHVVAERSGNSVRLSLDEGSESELASECARLSGVSACGATPIRSINGIRPDEDGNIVLWFH